MGDIFTDKQKAERLVGGASISLALLFPCPACGHSNKPARTKLQSVKMYLLDELPPCRRCGQQLRRGNFDRSTIPASLLRRAEAELDRHRIIKCVKCPQKLKAPTDCGRVKLRCPKCKAEFEFVP